MRASRIGLLMALAALAAGTLALAPAPTEAQGSEIEVRIAAIRLSDGRIEFALQPRAGSGWGERILPSRRYLPVASRDRWLASSAVVADGVEVRIAARRLADGRVEFALQSRAGSGWGERVLPSRRYFPVSSQGRWLSSSPIAVARAVPGAVEPDPSLLPEMSFADDIPHERRVEIRVLVAQVLEFYANRYDLTPFEFSVHFGVDTDPGVGAYAQGGSIYVGRYFVNHDGLGTALAHEYFHLLARRLQQLPAGATDASPVWLIEGTATYAGDVYETAHKIRSWDEIRASWIWESAALSATLTDMERWDGFHRWGFVSYHLAALATEWLVEYAGDDSYIRYWRLLAGAQSWRSAFETAFGITVDEFYQSFARDHERELASTFDWIRGRVLGPSGEALGGIELWTHPVAAGRSRFGRTDEDGTFDLAVPEGSYTIGVYRRPAGAWQVLGWYGDDGFTTERDRAATIAVGDGDASMLEIRLPSAIADLRPVP